MFVRILPAAVWLLLAVSLSGALPAVDFNRQVRPILAANCFKCHGLDETGRKGKFRLDERESAIHPAKSGDIAIVPGSPGDSEMLNRVTSEDQDEAMPPPETGKKLSQEQIAILRQWISEGAPYAKFWAFEKPVQAALPTVGKSAWPRQPFDAYVLAPLEAQGLEPSPEADKATLARRLALDLTGLPPSAEDRDAFLADASPEADERYVDKLLASPAYGERWARPWLDVARYADTKGYEKDLSRTIWPFRDWVIDALNADLPYDEFTKEQLAGDLLPHPTTAQLVATAFHRNTMTNEEGGVDAEEYRVAAVKDRVDTTVQAWMGVTMGCAKCHSHKYDPITQREYYQFYAFFNQTEDANRGDDSPNLDLPTKAEEQKRKALQAAVAAAEHNLAEPPQEVVAAMPTWEAAFARSAQWKIARPSAMKAASGSKMELQSDGAILVKGEGPAAETYTLELPAGVTKLTGLRIEALPDPANPKHGVGRANDDGNFVLTGLRLTAQTPDGAETVVDFTKAVADF
ncbi:MAG TPA: DUF1549 domain-containing protein, partial [Chthoniobacteraceae bacterium]